MACLSAVGGGGIGYRTGRLLHLGEKDLPLAPAAKRPAPPAPVPKPAPQPAPAPEAPPLPEEPPEPASAADTPPWVAPSPAPAPGPDKMDELLHNGQQLDSFQIK